MRNTNDETFLRIVGAAAVAAVALLLFIIIIMINDLWTVRNSARKTTRIWHVCGTTGGTFNFHPFRVSSVVAWQRYKNGNETESETRTEMSVLLL